MGDGMAPNDITDITPVGAGDLARLTPGENRYVAQLLVALSDDSQAEG